MSTDTLPPETTSPSPVASATSPAPSSPPPRPIRIGVEVIRFLMPIVILGLAILGAMALLSTSPEAVRTEYESRAALVETIVPAAGTEIAEIIAYGTVEPNRELVLQPQVGGRVVRMNENIRSGGRVTAGEMRGE